MFVGNAHQKTQILNCLHNRRMTTTKAVNFICITSNIANIRKSVTVAPQMQVWRRTTGVPRRRSRIKLSLAGMSCSLFGSSNNSGLSLSNESSCIEIDSVELSAGRRTDGYEVAWHCWRRIMTLSSLWPTTSRLSVQISSLLPNAASSSCMKSFRTISTSPCMMFSKYAWTNSDYNSKGCRIY